MFFGVCQLENKELRAFQHFSPFRALSEGFPEHADKSICRPRGTAGEPRHKRYPGCRMSASASTFLNPNIASNVIPLTLYTCFC